jgi:hypothetical protein
MGKIFTTLIMVVGIVGYSPSFAEEDVTKNIAARMEATRTLTAMEAAIVMQKMSTSEEACSYVEALCQESSTSVKLLSQAADQINICIKDPDCLAITLGKLERERQAHLSQFMRPASAVIIPGLTLEGKR